MIKLHGWEAAGSGSRVMPRCEAYQIGFSVSPIKDSAKESITDTCRQSHYIPEHLKFDEVKGGRLSYPLQENTVDVAYLDLKNDGEGPFLFFF